MTGVARRVDLDRHPHLRAREGVLEGQPHARLEVGAALGLGPRPPAAAAAEDAAELPEQVGEVDVLVGEAARPGTTRPGAARAVGAEGVELLALLGVGEQVVGALDLLEPLLGRGVTLVGVGMVLARELAIGLLDLVVGRRPRHAEDVVRAAGHGYSATITRAGRSTASPSR